ncbi:MAG: hypothetical protein KAX09_05500 [Candidatus Heimdallarchaeota archaeon]|nr:hypothetical protein [Candidatus Heimdallarchaeota archaeon]MCK4290421.1 hypothetical protein [Candidatus Heimdallarchaeota archaeon]
MKGITLSINEEIEQLIEKYQFNFELIKRLSFTYGLQRTSALIASLKEHTQSLPIRVNTQITTASKLIKTLNEKEIVAKQHPDFEEAVLLEISRNEVIPRKKKTITLNYKRPLNSVLIGVGIGSNDFEYTDDLNIGDEISLLDKKGDVVGNGILMMNMNELEEKKKGIAIKITESMYKIPSINGLKEYLRGQFIPQSIPSMLIGSSVNLKAEDRLLDMNSDTGEILTHIWQRNFEVKDSKIVAQRSTAHKLTKFNENIKRLRMYKAPIVRENLNLSAFVKKYNKEETFDLIIANPPSTDMGLRPKIFEMIRESQIIEYSRRQRRYLIHAARLLKPGGTLFYTTNSLDPAENEGNIQFAIEELNFTIEKQELFFGVKCSARFPGSEHLQYFYPDVHDTPGQFIAKLRKNG